MNVDDEGVPLQGEAQGEVGRRQRLRAASRSDETKNACLKESVQLLKCTSEHDVDRDKCMLHFLNYKNCLDFWKRVRADRMQRGIKPPLPPPEERESVRQEYSLKWAKQQTN